LGSLRKAATVTAASHRPLIARRFSRFPICARASILTVILRAMFYFSPFTTAWVKKSLGEIFAASIVAGCRGYAAS
jgi:hypothetical protein